MMIGKKGRGPAAAKEALARMRARSEGVSSPALDRLPPPSARVALRAVVAEDFDLYRAAVETPELRAYRSDPEPAPDGVLRAAFDAILEAQGHGVLAYAITDRGSGRAIGYIALFDVDNQSREAEVMTYISPESQQSGFAREAMASILEHAFRTLGLEKVMMTHHANNERWRPGAEKLGFAEAKRLRNHRQIDGTPVDQVIMEVTKESFVRGRDRGR